MVTTTRATGVSRHVYPVAIEERGTASISRSQRHGVTDDRTGFCGSMWATASALVS